VRSDFEKRLQALERAIITKPTELVFCWTPSLAERISAVLPKHYKCVCLRFDDEAPEAEFEAALRENNPEEAARLDALLRGEVA
jgi:hypothetical protein